MTLRFDAFSLDPESGELRKGDRVVPLKPQPMRLLTLLVSRAGSVVTREQIQKELWPDDTFVDFDLGINSCIRQIRNELGDDAEAPRYVQTLSRRGYRFLVSPQDDSGAAAETVERLPVGKASASVAVWFPWILAALAAAAFAVWWSGDGTSPPLPPPVALTSFPGQEAEPAFSPDGNSVAFVWKKEGDDNFDLYVKLIDAENPLRLTHTPTNEASPAWSPDGRRIAFLREQSTDAPTELVNFYHADVDHEIVIVPALGGPERKLGTSRAGGHGLSWAPDGEHLAIVDVDVHGEPEAIFLLSTRTAKKTRLTRPPSNIIGDQNPVFSPDGESLAFIRRVMAVQQYVYSVSPDGDNLKRLTSQSAPIRGLTWTADGRGIVYAANRRMRGQGQHELWMVPASGGEPQVVAPGEEHAEWPTVPHAGGNLAYVRHVQETNIWRVPGPAAASRNHAPENLIASTAMDGSPAYSPDGKRIVFSSSRSGNAELWISDTDGRNPQKLLSMEGAEHWSRWSPDGRYLAFHSHPVQKDDYLDIYVLEVDSGAVRRLTKEPSLDVAPTWSRDGRWIYFSSDRTSARALDGAPVAPMDRQIWKIPAEGGGAVQVTTHGGIGAIESEDGKLLYFGKEITGGIWSVPVDGGEEVLVVEQADFSRWGLFEQSLCYVNGSAVPEPTIECFDSNTNRVQQIAVVGRSVRDGFAISPDGEWILYGRRDVNRSDIMLLPGF